MVTKDDFSLLSQPVRLYFSRFSSRQQASLDPFHFSHLKDSQVKLCCYESHTDDTKMLKLQQCRVTIIKKVSC